MSRPELPLALPNVVTGWCHHQPITGHFLALFVISPLKRKWPPTGEMLDCEQSLFSSKIRGKERKTSKRVNVTVSVTWVPWAASSVGGGRRAKAISLFLENPWERTQNKKACERDCTVSVTWVPRAASSVGVGKNTSTVMRLTLISDNNLLLCSVFKVIVFVLNFYLAMSYSHWLSCNCFVFCWEGMFLSFSDAHVWSVCMYLNPC